MSQKMYENWQQNKNWDFFLKLRIFTLTISDRSIVKQVNLYLYEKFPTNYIFIKY